MNDNSKYGFRPIHSSSEAHHEFLGGVGRWVEDIFTVSPEEKAEREKRRQERQAKRDARRSERDSTKTQKEEEKKAVIAQAQMQEQVEREAIAKSVEEGIMGKYCQLIDVDRYHQGAQGTTVLRLKVPLMGDVKTGEIIKIDTSEPYYDGISKIMEITPDRKAIVIDKPFQPIVNPYYRMFLQTQYCKPTKVIFEGELFKAKQGGEANLPLDITSNIYRDTGTSTWWWIGGTAVIIGLGVGAYFLFKSKKRVGK